jgi:hypothetical protein
VELVHADFKIDLKIGDETEKIEVIRWQFPLLHGMLRTAYSINTYREPRISEFVGLDSEPRLFKPLDGKPKFSI